jgi:hypothetical protein
LPHRELIEVLRLDGRLTFSQDNSWGETGSVLRFEFSKDEAVTILESSMPPCYQDADVVQHTPNEVRDVDGKRYVEVETRRDTTTYLFILSESQPECSPQCCFTFFPVPNFSTGVVRSSGLFPTATAVRGLPLAMFPGTAMPGTVVPGTETSPSHTLISASSLATGTLYGVPSKGSRAVSPPIENSAAVAICVSWLFKPCSMAASLGLVTWLAK